MSYVLVFDSRPEPVGIPTPGRYNFPLTLATGPQGAAGKSAYELAVDEGFEGSLQDWLDMQRGILVLNEGDPTPDPGTLLDHTLLLERV